MDTAASRTSAQPSLERFSLAQTLFFHFMPGIMVTLGFVTIAWFTVPRGWPPSLALLLTWPLIGIPVLVGILFFRGYQLNGILSLKDVLLYRQPLPWRQYAWLVPALLIWTALTSTLLFSFGEAIRLTIFASWPNWLILSTLAQNVTRYSSTMLWTIVALSAVLNIAVPITEELYFRSFLLPRLPASPKWAPLLSAVLFSLYHLWLPWDFIGRIIALLPAVYVAQWKRNVYVSILVHCLLNLIGTVGLATLVMGAGK